METGNQRARQTGLRGMNLVIDELEKRGASVEVGGGQANLLYVRSKNGAHQFTIRTKTKGPTSRDWQVSTTEARKPKEPVDSDEFWVLVDLCQRSPAFYVIPGAWFRRNIYAEHQKYLEYHGDERPVTPGSTHHRVELIQVRDFKNRWDLLRI